MIKMFMGVTIGIIVAMIASLVAVALIYENHIISKFENDPPPHISGFAIQASRRIESAPAEKIEELLESMRKLYKFDMEIINKDSNKISPKIKKVLMNKKLAWTIEDDEPLTFSRLKNGKVLLIATHAGPPLPDTQSALLMIGAIIEIVTLVAFLLALPVVKRLRKLEVATMRISKGELDARVDLHTHDPVGQLAKRFNQMADRVQYLLENQKQLLQAVSHELRTPCARIRFGLEMLQVAKNHEDRDRRIEAIDDDLVELDKLVEELLIFNRFDESQSSLEKIDINVHEEIEDLLSYLRRQGSNIEIKLNEANSSVQIEAHRTSFRRAMQNLVMNAVKYATNQVNIKVETNGSNISVAISDDGPGIPPDQRNRVFQPFSRLDDSRSKGSGGVGLGLAIVARIIKAHNATIEITESEKGGAKVTTTWPA